MRYLTFLIPIQAGGGGGGPGTSLPGYQLPKTSGDLHSGLPLQLRHFLVNWRMSWAPLAFLITCTISQAQTVEVESSAKTETSHGRPAQLTTMDLAEFEGLPADRKNLIEGAIAVAKNSPWLPYRFGGADPGAGGFDCSGAMYYVLGKAGLAPPRSSAEQYLWLQENKRLIEVSQTATDLDDPELQKLKPGDLLFWGGTYKPTDGRTVNVTHVALYLGKEKKDGRPVMINATDGRSYRGVQANGYGVYDFQLPKEGGRSIFMGFGTPPGIAPL